MPENIISMRNIVWKFADRTILDNVSFDLRKGEIHVLIGENGAGKTKLMETLCGLTKKDSGTILYKGESVEITSPTQAQNMGICMVHQESALFEQYTIAENIFIQNKPLKNKFLKTVDVKKMNKDAQDILNKLNCDLKSETVVSKLTVGEKYIVEIAKAIALQAEVIIFDETTAYFALKETNDFYKMLHTLKEKGRSIVYITHKIDNLTDVVDRISAIRNGKITLIMSNDDMEIGKLITGMSGDSYKNRYPKIKTKFGTEMYRVQDLSVVGYVQDISFSLRKGEILGFAGLMGSGRTKMARAMFGLEPYHGEFYVRGKKVNIKNTQNAISNGIAFISEDRTESVFSKLSVRGNISSVKKKGLHGKMIFSRAKEREILEEFGKRFNVRGMHGRMPMYQLSGGAKQKVNLARWIFSQSDIYIFNEPTAGLDIPSKVDVYNIFNDLVRKGKSIIIISSDINEIVGMCDRVFIIYEGRIVKELLDKDANSKNILYYAMGGK